MTIFCNNGYNGKKKNIFLRLCQPTFFIENKFLRLLDQDDIDSSTYVVQYFTDTKEKYDKYLNEYASLFRGKAFEK